MLSFVYLKMMPIESLYVTSCYSSIVTLPGVSFIGKDEWPPNSPDLNPLDHYVRGAMLEHYK